MFMSCSVVAILAISYFFDRRGHEMIRRRPVPVIAGAAPWKRMLAMGGGFSLDGKGRLGLMLQPSGPLRRSSEMYRSHWGPMVKSPTMPLEVCGHRDGCKCALVRVHDRRMRDRRDHIRLESHPGSRHGVDRRREANPPWASPRA